MAKLGLPNSGESSRARRSGGDRSTAPIWILSGDFNCTPTSAEYHRLVQANFVDVCPEKGSGTKGNGFGSEPTITCDYIFAGPKYIALEPLVPERALTDNPPPIDEVRVSDHVPLFARIPVFHDGR